MRNKMIFIDASLFLAYYGTKDVLHKNAKELWPKIESGIYGSTFTSDYIFNEVIGVVRRKVGKEAACILGNQIRETTVIVNIDDHMFEESWKFFNKTETALSLVDCTSIIVCRLAKTKYIATFDKEFKKVKELDVVD